MSSPIEDYALVGDLQTAALISKTGSVDWGCLPRFDSPAPFAGLLGTQEHGFWRLGPAADDGLPAAADHRQYQRDSLVLDSFWITEDGTLQITDFMPPWDARTTQPRLIRIAQVLNGQMTVRSEFRPRMDYGGTTPRIMATDGRAAAVAGPHALYLDAASDTTVPITAADGALRTSVTLTAGQRIAFTMSWAPSHADPPPVTDAGAALAHTRLFWTGWAATCTYSGPYRDAVMRSLITLKALTHAETGGIVAAPTTSLPEEIGGCRTWDYRYCWLRDASLTLSSLLRTGYREEARSWTAWLLRAVAGDPEKLQIMYGIGGERRLPEIEIPWLPGYENSAPVRIGNGAATQLQLDVYGEVIETLHRARAAGLPLTETAADLQIQLAHWIESNWQQPDEGIWEIRGARRHFVHSKVQSWAAIDRTIQLIESGAAEGPLDRWKELRATIHHDICIRGYDAVRNTFTQSYGSAELDASLLLIPLVGFLPPDDKRVIGTIEAVQRDLGTGDDGLILRYRTAGAATGADGLEGDEGAFLACSFWLVEALTMIGRTAEARALFEKLLSLANDVGLLAEEYDCAARRQLGNFPQAFSHFPLVSAALRLSSHEKTAASDFLTLAHTETSS